MTDPGTTASHSPTDPAEAFAAVVSLRRRASQLERAAVDGALHARWTWAQIGQALGMTAQAAHKRLAPARRPDQINDRHDRKKG